MKILIVNCVYDPEPVVSAQLGKSLAERLSRLDHDVRVLAPFPTRPHGFKFDVEYNRGEINLEKVNDKLSVCRLPTFVSPRLNQLGRLRESISFGLASYRYINSHSHDIDKVYMNTWPIFGQFGVALACIRKKIKFIIHIQDVYPESLTNKLSSPFKQIVYSLLFPIERFILRNAEVIIAISNKMGEYLVSTRKLPRGKVQVVNNWQNDEDFKDFEGHHLSEKLTFMYLGNIGPVAGIPALLRSFVNSNINAKLIIAGSGSMKAECEELARTFPSVDISFIDVPEGKVPEVQSKADIFVLPIIKGAAGSSVPSKLPAYMFSGKPVMGIVDLGSETERVIVEAECGWVVEPENHNAIIALFQRIVTLPKHLIERKGKNALEYGKENFSKDNNLQKLVNLVVLK